MQTMPKVSDRTNVMIWHKEPLPIKLLHFFTNILWVGRGKEGAKEKKNAVYLF